MNIAHLFQMGFPHTFGEWEQKYFPLFRGVTMVCADDNITLVKGRRGIREIAKSGLEKEVSCKKIGQKREKRYGEMDMEMLTGEGVGKRLIIKGGCKGSEERGGC